MLDEVDQLLWSQVKRPGNLRVATVADFGERGCVQDCILVGDRGAALRALGFFLHGLHGLNDLRDGIIFGDLLPLGGELRGGVLAGKGGGLGELRGGRLSRLLWFRHRICFRQGVVL